MKYNNLEEINKLVGDKLVSRRQHSSLPLYIYNYSASAQGLPISQWSDTLKDCRGLILDDQGEIVGRGFKKFWNYEQVLDQIPNEPFDVFEKLDGSLIIVCTYDGKRVVATRGSFESDQAKWAAQWFDANKDLRPKPSTSFLFEGIFPANRIVVDYGDKEECVLLDVVGHDGASIPYENGWDFTEAKRYDGITAFGAINDDESLAGQEGFVVRWQSGFRAKVKLEEYKRLHRLITQCSTRTIWELLRSGKDISELIDRVPEDFKQWVVMTSIGLTEQERYISSEANERFKLMPTGVSRKEYAMCATAAPAPYPPMLFALLDGKPIDDMIWKYIEPKWATPFRKESE